MNGSELVAAERQRQIDAHWPDRVHDLFLQDMAAAFLLCSDRERVNMVSLGIGLWWEIEKEMIAHDEIRFLTIAGALICAEIDRLQRQADQEGTQ